MVTSTLYLEHFQLDKPPFDQEPDTDLVFPASGRTATLRNLLADIESGNPLVKLIGSEGTGKTLLCRLLERALDHERYQVVTLEYPVGSYENLLRTICLALGVSEEERDDEDAPPPDFVTIFREYLQKLEIQGKYLVLLIDEAENLFLATLERLIRLLCDSEINNLQILLSGRSDLEAHLDQLAVYCSSVDLSGGYTLEPLSHEETKQYIYFRLNEAGIPGDKYLEAFNEEAIEAIYLSAMGNISLTNSLAELGLRRAAEVGKFQVDEGLILSEQTVEENVSLAVFQGFDFVKDNKWWLLLGTLLIWILLMVLWPDSDKPDSGQIPYAENGEQLEIIPPGQEIVIPPVPEPTPVPERQDVVVEDKPKPPAEEIAEQQAAEEEARPVKPKREAVVVNEPEEMIAVKPLEEVETSGRQEGMDLEPEEQSTTPGDDEKIVIQPDRRKKIVIEKAAGADVPSTETGALISEPRQATEPVKKIVAEERDADVLFRERLEASSAWGQRAQNKEYTIQLMVLASVKAEENLKKIIVDDKYYKYKNQLYILRKTRPKVLYVFFGHYPSMDQARKSRNNMPKFLRDNQPYVLSIRDALQKTKQ